MIISDHNTTLVETVLGVKDGNEVMQVGAAKEYETHSKFDEWNVGEIRTSDEKWG
jgi:hypothetical protein